MQNYEALKNFQKERILANTTDMKPWCYSVEIYYRHLSTEIVWWCLGWSFKTGESANSAETKRIRNNFPLGYSYRFSLHVCRSFLENNWLAISTLE